MEARKISKDQIRYIQIERRRAGIDDETYAQMKRSVGVESTIDLDQRRFSELLKRIGKAAKQAAKRASAHSGERTAYKKMHSSAYASGMHVAPPEDRAPMIQKIEAILTDLKEPWGYADAIAKQMFGVDLLRWCDSSQTYKVLQALIYHQQRQTGRHDREFYLRELKSDGCMCGKPKKKNFSFCWTCFQRLPEEMRKSLYRRMGRGYEEAYDAAVRYLSGDAP